MNNTGRVSQPHLFGAIGSEKLLEREMALTPQLQTFGNQLPPTDRIQPERVSRRPLRGWNDTHAPYPNACVHDLFEQQVERDPEAVAVCCNGRQLSYRDLNERSNQVARYLRKRGVGPESLVGVCLERSLELVIALFGVWKAGGAYIPLDPAYPKERLSFMVRDMEMKALLTDEKSKSLIRSAPGFAIRLDTEWPVIAQENKNNFSSTASPSNLAYVMYTSGSTGQPKGVMIQHNGLVNYLSWAIKAYEVEGNGPVPVHSSIAFDSTVASLYPPLLSGGQIELLPEDMGGQNLLAALRRVKNRNKLVITPAHLEMLNDQLSPEEMAGITKVLVVAGDALNAEKLSKWRDFAPGTRLFNEYGPTETTVGCSAYEVLSSDPRTGPVPIGSPIFNAQLYVLNADLQPVPLGVIGELYIGGDGVGRGYLGQPDLTRERFLPDTFSGRSDARLYKTGDLVRYRADGTLEFLGRADNQAKIRGYRIELGEIESTLAAYPGIQSCLVLAREDTPGDKHLVAYILSRQTKTVETESIRKFLKQRLPDFMVPGYFVFLSSFPLTHNGKVNRKALPPPSYRDISSDQPFVAPSTETEKKLAAIWMELLKVNRVGIHDNFFEMGGHSLLAIRAMSRIQEMFGVFPSMHAFFPDATIAGLTKALEVQEDPTEKLAYAVAVQKKGKELPFFWVGPSARGHALSNQLGTNHPFFSAGFEPAIADQLKAPYRMDELAQHLVLAIREKQPHGPYRLGGFCIGAVIAYEVARQLMAQGEEVAQLVLLEPLNPRRGKKARLVTGVRRMSIRVRFRVAELLRMKFSEYPAYARSRCNGVKCLLKDVIWNFSARSRFQAKQLPSDDLAKILYFAASSYEPKPLDCPTVIFRCKDWPMLAAGDPYFGWREFLTGHSGTDEIPGDHAGIFSEPNVTVLAEKLKVCLQTAKQVETLT